MSEDPQHERIEQLVDELEELPYEERESAVSALPEADREAVWETELERSEDAVPDDYEDLGAGE
jgi:hypothetical protein